MATGPGVDFGMTADASSVIRALDRIVQNQNRVIAGFQKTSTETKQTTSHVNTLGTRAVSQLGGMVAGLASIGTAIALVRKGFGDWVQKIGESVTSMKELQKEFVNLQFLGEHYRDETFRKRLMELSKVSGLPGAELAKGIYALESMASYAAPAQRADMLASLIKLRKTTNVPLEGLVPTFAKMGAIYPGLTGQEMSTLTQFWLEKAATTSPAELGEYAPKMLAAGRLGKLDPRTAAAIGTVLTAKTGTVAQAASGMQILLRKVMLTEPDEEEVLRGLGKKGKKRKGAGREEIFKAAGISTEDDAYARLTKLSVLYAAGKIDAQAMKDLFGERGMMYGQILMEDPEGLKRMVAEFQTGTAKGIDIVGKKLGEALRVEPQLRMMEAGERITAATEAARQRPENLMWANLEAVVERLWQEGRIPWHEYGLPYLSAKKVAGMRRRLPKWLGGKEAVPLLAEWLKGWGIARSAEEARMMAEQWITPSAPAAGREAITGLQEAAQNLLNVSENLDAAVEKLQDSANNLERTTHRAPPVAAHAE